MKQTRALAFISAVVLLAGSAAAPVAAADSVESLKTVSTSDNLGGVAQVSPRINRWVTYKGYKYWFNSKGKMVKDAIIGINGKIYCFDARGRLMTSRFIRKGSIVYFADRRSIRSSFISVSGAGPCRESRPSEKNSTISPTAERC